MKTRGFYFHIIAELCNMIIKYLDMETVAIKPGPKPKKEDGTLDKRRRDNKNTPGNTPKLKPSKPKK